MQLDLVGCDAALGTQAAHVEEAHTGDRRAALQAREEAGGR
jgi:hypothetical protein